MTISTVTTDETGIKSRLKAIWSAGDYDRFSRSMEAGAREFYDRLTLTPGSKLLDVGCGSGQLALMAAREGLDVVGVDISENGIERARIRARAEKLRARFEQADAEALPFEDGTFDAVVSLIGAMFAPQPGLVARELLRVCAPGGMVAMANWTSQGFVGQMFKIVAKFIAPSGMPSPTLWGEESVVRERLGHGLAELSLARRQYLFSYPFPPSEVVEFFRLNYGPTNRAFAALDVDGQHRLRQELDTLWSTHNQSGPDSTIVFAEYLEVIGTKQ